MSFVPATGGAGGVGGVTVLPPDFLEQEKAIAINPIKIMLKIRNHFDIVF